LLEVGRRGLSSFSQAEREIVIFIWNYLPCL